MKESTMTVDEAHAIVQQLQEEGVDAEVMEDYSGRGMFGRTCPAITGERAILTEIGYAASQIGMARSDVPSRTDSMGLGIVVY
jgi:phage gp45-like